MRVGSGRLIVASRRLFIVGIPTHPSARGVQQAPSSRWSAIFVNKSRILNGRQAIFTVEGYVIPLNIILGLPRLRIRPYTDAEFEDDTIPHVIMTGESEWNPMVLDSILDDDENWFDAIQDLQIDPEINRFDEVGDYRNRVIAQEHAAREEPEAVHEAPREPPPEPDPDLQPPADRDKVTSFTAKRLTARQYDSIDDMIEDSVYSTYVSEVLSVPAAQVKKKNPDFEVLRPLFGWLPVETVKRTWECTTQMATIPISTILKKHYKSQNPAFNVARRNEPVATDTIFSDTPAIDSGCKIAQLFVGTESLVTDAYPMKTNDEFVNTLEDNIRERGAMTKLISDRAQAEISNKVQDILHTLVIKSWQSEPHQQHQNFAERRYQTIKTVVNTILDRVGAPAYTWLLCLL